MIEAGKRHYEADPTQFNDPIAFQTEWSLLSRSRSIYGIVEVDSDRVEFRITWEMILYNVLSFNIYCILFISLLVLKYKDILIKYEYLALPLLVVGNLVTLACTLYFCRLPVVFDKRRGYFWKGSNEFFNEEVGADYVKLERIHALQLIIAIHKAEKGGFCYSYELNLVLDTGARINVVHHGNKYRIQKDARVLSKFLGVPLWEVTIKS